MGPLHALLAHPLVERLGWALLHFLWQGTTLALLLGVATLALRRRSPNARYVAACMALAAMAVAPIITMLTIPAQTVPESNPVIASEEPLPALTASPPISVSFPLIEDTLADVPMLEPPASSPAERAMPQAVPSATEARIARPWSERALEFLDANLPWLVVAWFAGVLCLSVRLIGGCVLVRRVRHSGTEQRSGRWQDVLVRLSARLRVTRPVQLLESALARAPIAIGWLRPVILFPASALAGLSPDQLEAILAHELAHIRRYDYLVNLLQSVVETLLFYHPALWWVSHRIRIEREHCCDDLAVAACGDSVTYARALARMEELRSVVPQPALAAGGGSLLARIQRLLGLSTDKANRSSHWLAGALVVAVVLVIASVLLVPDLVAQSKQDTAERSDSLQPAPKGEQALLSEWRERKSSIGLTITGRVLREPGGEGVEGAVLRLTLARGHDDVWMAWSGENGTYSFAGLDPGDYRIEVDYAPNVPSSVGTEPVEVAVGPVSVQAKDLCLRLPQSVSGTVYDKGTGLPVCGELLHCSGSRRPIVTDAGGRYCLYVLPRAVGVQCRAVSSDRQRKAVTVGPAENVRDVDFAVEPVLLRMLPPDGKGPAESRLVTVETPFVVTGQVLLPDGRAAKDVPVDLQLDWDNHMGGGTSHMVRLKTNPEGKFVLRMTMPSFGGGVYGALGVKAVSWLPDRSMAGVAYEKSDGPETSLGPIKVVLESSASITLRIVDPDGKPIARARIRASDRQPGLHHHYSDQAEYLGDGRYRMTRMIPGLDYYFRIRAAGYSSYPQRPKGQRYVASPGENLDAGTVVLKPTNMSEGIDNLTKHEGWTWRRAAARQLGELGPDAVPAITFLIQALRDPHPKVRFSACRALGKLGPAASEAVPELITVLKEEKYGFVRRESARTLELIDAAAARPALKDALEDEDAHVRQYAAQAIQRLESGTEGALPAPLAAKSEEVRWGETANGLQCRLLPQTQTVSAKEGEKPEALEVYITFELRNTGEVPVKIQLGYPLEVFQSETFRVIRPDGTQTDWLLEVPGIEAPDPGSFATVPVGETITRRTRLWCDFTQPGTYEISATVRHTGYVGHYYGGDFEKATQNPDHVYSGTLKSNTVTVEVARPPEPALLRSSLSIEEAMKEGYAFVAVCQALEGPKAISGPSMDVQHETRNFKVVQILLGKGPGPETIELRCTYWAYVIPFELRVGQGESVIWIVRDSGGAPRWMGVKAVPDTPENREAVIRQAATMNMARGEVVNGLQVSIWTEKDTFAINEPIPVHWRIENVGTEDRAIVWHPGHYSPVAFEIGRKGERRQVRHLPITPFMDKIPWPPQNLILKPGDAKEAQFKLRRFGVTRPGTYEISGLYAPRESWTLPRYLTTPPFAETGQDRIASGVLAITVDAERTVNAPMESGASVKHYTFDDDGSLETI